SDGDVITVDPSSIILLTEPMTPNGLTFKPIPYMQPFLFIPEYLEYHALAHEYYTQISKKKKGIRQRRLIPIEDRFKINMD
ncbi:18737_t:CDS:2, partial [Racocetra fulgida]